MCSGNGREEIKHSTIGKGGSQVGREDTVTNATLKVQLNPILSTNMSRIVLGTRLWGYIGK